MPSVPRNNGTRQDTFRILVQIGGNDWGTWDKKTGGELDSDEVKYYPGGMEAVQSLGGRITPANLVLQRLYDRKDDHDRIQSLFNAVGKQNVKVTQRPLTLNGDGYGKLVTWTGVLKRVLVPDVDSEATSAALIEIEVSVGSPPAAI
jgi:hypothetical protein